MPICYVTLKTTKVKNSTCASIKIKLKRATESSPRLKILCGSRFDFEYHDGVDFVESSDTNQTIR